MTDTMTGRARMRAAFAHQPTDTVPVSPDLSAMVPVRLTGRPFDEMFLDGLPHHGYASASVAQAYVADEFAYLARTPAKAGTKALEKVGKTIDDVERVELNEAFSSVVVHSAELLGADPERVNVNGGAVALGHPIGASGARILTTMVHELRRNGGGLGLAAICSGGGGGDAVLIEV